MKRLSVLWIPLFVFCTVMTIESLPAQSCPAPPPAFEKSSLVGEWIGSYTYEGKTYDLNVSFQMEGEKLTATSSMPDLDIPSSEFTSWVCQSNELHMRLDLPRNQAVKLIGRPNNGVLSGRFVYNQPKGVCGASKDRFTLTKVGSSNLAGM